MSCATFVSELFVILHFLHLSPTEDHMAGGEKEQYLLCDKETLLRKDYFHLQLKYRYKKIIDKIEQNLPSLVRNVEDKKIS